MHVHTCACMCIQLHTYKHACMHAYQDCPQHPDADEWDFESLGPHRCAPGSFAIGLPYLQEQLHHVYVYRHG